MSTLIERQLHGDLPLQGIIGLVLSPGVMRIELAPWEGPRVTTIATFTDAKLTSIEAFPDDVDDLNLPWDLIGCDCHDLGERRWRFVFHCASIEWSFESGWPVVNGLKINIL